MLFSVNAILAQDIVVYDGTSQDFRINAGVNWLFYPTPGSTDKCPYLGDNCTIAVTANVTKIVTVNGGISSIEITLQNDGIYTVNGSDTYPFEKPQDTITLGEIDVPLETRGSTGTFRVNVVDAPYDYSRRIVQIK